MAFLIKILMNGWPFFREVVLQNSTFRQLVRKNKVLAAGLAINVVLFVLFVNAYTEAQTKNIALINMASDLKTLQSSQSGTKEYYLEKLKTTKDYYDAVINAKDFQIKTLDGQLTEYKEEVVRLKDENEKLKSNQPKGKTKPPQPTRSNQSYLDRLERLRQSESRN